MAIKLNGDPHFTSLVSNLEGDRLHVATAFGTSMLPFLKPGAELQLELLETASVRLGDIITFQSQSGTLVTHRVVKILRNQNKRSFLTKGDNRLNLDSVVFHHQIFGRVSEVNGATVRSMRYRVLGRMIAWVSYGQFVIYQGLSKSSFNRFICWLQKKGWFPRVSPGPWILKFANPMSWCAWIQSALNNHRIWRLGRQLRQKRITFESWSVGETEQMTQVWNEVFPDYSTNVQRLNQMVFEGRGFDSSAFFLAKQDSRLLGWVLARPEGSIDVFALRKEGWQMHLDQILFQKVLTWFKTHRVRQVFLNSHPIPESPFGIQVTPLVSASSAFGFEPTEVSMILTVTPSTYHPPVRQKLPDGLVIRFSRETDDVALADFFRRSGRQDVNLFYDYKDARVRQSADILLATLGDSIVGFCRCVMDDEVRDYDDVTWIWVLAQPTTCRGYFLRLLVDSNARNQGIGTALAVHAFGYLFNRGCEEIALVVIQDKALEYFYERFGFQKTGYFLKSRRIEKI